MKIKIFTFIILSAVCMVLLMPLSVFAGRYTKTAQFSSIGITINGEEYNVRPIIIDGTSYFPVRTIGNALNCTVEWSAEPKKITLTSQSSPVEAEDFLQSNDETFNTKEAVFDDSITLTANNKAVVTPIAIVDDRSYVPIKAVAEAMNKRATWYESSRTIVIVNPETVQVDEAIKDYYVYDLPDITSEEDYLVGNWKGSATGYTSSGLYYDKDSQIFISKRDDGTYKVIYRNVVTGGNKWPIGSVWTVELTGRYNSSTQKFTCTFKKWIENDTTTSKYTTDVFLLKNEILYYESGLQNGDISGEFEKF